jgi:hypothetical protein
VVRSVLPARLAPAVVTAMTALPVLTVLPARLAPEARMALRVLLVAAAWA